LLEPKVQVFVEFIGFVEFIELTQATQLTQVTQLTTVLNIFSAIVWLEQIKIVILLSEMLQFRTGGSPS